MKLQELFSSDNLIIQIVWGEKKIEFDTEIVDRDTKGIYVRPYIHNGAPLSLTINSQSGVVCNIFGDDPNDGKRVSWRNIELDTVISRGRTLYYLMTSSYNSASSVAERRADSRVRVTNYANLYDPVAQKNASIKLHDVSDSGIAFYAPTTFEPKTNIFEINFSDMINDHRFDIIVKCKVVRTKRQVGTIFYGCKLVAENNDYLLYGFMTRMAQKAPSENPEQ